MSSTDEDDLFSPATFCNGIIPCLSNNSALEDMVKISKVFCKDDLIDVLICDTEGEGRQIRNRIDKLFNGAPLIVDSAGKLAVTEAPHTADTTLQPMVSLARTTAEDYLIYNPRTATSSKETILVDSYSKLRAFDKPEKTKRSLWDQRKIAHKKRVEKWRAKKKKNKKKH